MRNIFATAGFFLRSTCCALLGSYKGYRNMTSLNTPPGSKIHGPRCLHHKACWQQPLSQQAAPSHLVRIRMAPAGRALSQSGPLPRVSANLVMPSLPLCTAVVSPQEGKAMLLFRGRLL